MPDSDQIIPFDRLPPGFAESIDAGTSSPAVPKPAATVVLMREATADIEILLLRRSRSAGFVPGAFVFPGGRVDDADGGEDVLGRIQGLDLERAAARLGIAPDSRPSPTAYWVTAVREAFEETGLITGPDAGAPPASKSPRVEAIRDALMTDAIGWAEALTRLDVSLDLAAMEYIAHWITPEAEPRRYDTRFFAAEVGADSDPVVDPREMVEALWLTPGDALDRQADGRLPMVFPTVHTIRELSRFRSCGDVLHHFRSSSIPAILPKLVRTPTGIGLEVDETPG